MSGDPVSGSDSGRIELCMSLGHSPFYELEPPYHRDLIPKAACNCIVDTWALKQLPYHNFAAYVYTIKLLGAFGNAGPLGHSFGHFGGRLPRRPVSVRATGPSSLKFPGSSAASCKSSELPNALD